MRTSTFLLSALLLLSCVACGSDDSAGAAADATAVAESTVDAATPSAATDPVETPAVETPAEEPTPSTETPAEATVAEPLDAIELEPTGQAICDVVAALDFSDGDGYEPDP